jgi:hypothetical protein
MNGIKFDYTEYINWINKQDLFYVKDMLTNFNIERSSTTTREESAIANLLISARYEGYIQGCGKTGSNTQYITVSKIPLDIKIRRKSSYIKNKSANKTPTDKND